MKEQKSRKSATNHAKPPKLPFPARFQSRVLRLCLENPEWLPHIKHSYFDAPLEGRVFEILQRMKQPVSVATLALTCKPELGKAATLRVLLPLKKPLTDADRAYLETALRRFIRFQTIGESLVAASDLYRAQDVDGLIKLQDRMAEKTPGDVQPLKLTRASDIEPKAVSYLWRQRVAIGKLNLIFGDPGKGKSAVGVDLAARYSRGGPWPCRTPGRTKPGVTLILSGEDDADDTIVPRLIAAGADMTKIHIHDGADAEAAFSIRADLTTLERWITETKASLVVIDTVNDFLGDIDGQRIQDVKQVLGRLRALAKRLGVAVVLVTHMSKATDRTALQRIIGSMGFGATVRLAFLVAPDPRDLFRRRQLFTWVKGNNGPSDVATLSFVASPVHVKDQQGRVVREDDGRKADFARLTWAPYTKRVDPDALLRDLTKKPSPRKIAAGVLKHELRVGPVLVTVLQAALADEGISMPTARRAKKMLKLDKFKCAGHWYWTDWTKAEIARWKTDRKKTQQDDQHDGHRKK